MPNVSVLSIGNNRIKAIPILLNLKVLWVGNNKIKDYSKYVYVSRYNMYLRRLRY